MMFFLLPFILFFAIQSSTRSPLNELADLDYQTKKINIDGQVITRSILFIDGLPVEGADSIYDKSSKINQFYFTPFKPPKDGFTLSAAECMEIAIRYHGRSTVKNPYVERIAQMYQPMWLMHFDELRPVFKVRLPTISIFDLKDFYVDASNGEILQIDDVAQFISAPSDLFVYSPRSMAIDEKELKRVSLTDLVELKDNGFLHGKYMRVRTCCPYFTCPSEGPCNEYTKRCALRSHIGARQRRELVELPTSTLGLSPDLEVPRTIFVDTVRCTYLPFARASYRDDKQRHLGFFDRPIDRAGFESEMDRFSEIQAYFSMMSFFKNIRLLLNDDSWCLREEAMSCQSDGSPVVDNHGYPRNPYRIFVNQLIPDTKLDGPNSDDQDALLPQVLAGAGTRNNPVQLNSFTRFGNAAFVPALSTLKKDTPRADEILSDLIKPFDHNVFFQGDRDFAYDGDVVFHEFMHAITTSLINKINSLGLDEWGIHSQPGSLNEAWSDYFAAAFTEDPAIGEYASVKNGYAEISLRNIDNQASCPDDIIGEAHHDGLVWSGALWEIRSHIKNNFGKLSTIEFDRAVLASLSMATTTEDFKTQSKKLMNNIKSRELLGKSVADLASRILTKRGVSDCFRAFTLSAVDDKNRLVTKNKDLLFVPSKNHIGLKNYAPATSQLEIGIPAGATGLRLSWRQYFSGTGAMLGQESTPESSEKSEPLGVLTSFDAPIVWQFKSALSIPSRLKQTMTAPPISASYKGGRWQTYIPLDLARCEQRTMYISLLSKDHKYVLEDLSVKFDIDESADLSRCHFTGSLRSGPFAEQPTGCSSTKGRHLPIIALMMLLSLLLRRKGRVIDDDRSGTIGTGV